MKAPRRLLMVSPNFPPLNSADHQRVRMSLPYLEEFGWRPTVLHLEPSEADGVPDPDLVQTVPEGVERIRFGALPRRYTRLVGLGSTGLRALPYLRGASTRIHAAGPFDLAFFSTTVFPVFAMGPRWKRRFGVPYVLDYQDPWTNEYYDQPGAPPPPGGAFKYRVLARPVARWLEPEAVRESAAIIGVSDAYGDDLSARYGIERSRYTTIPFATSESDYDVARSAAIHHDVYTPGDGLRHWVSIGAATPAYAPLIRMLFEAFAKHRAEQPEACSRVRFHFVGTSYSTDPARQGQTVADLAREIGIADVVEERAMRIPYLSALKAMAQSDAVLAIGNTDAAHTASKIYPAVLSRRPLLAIYHERSSVLRILRECRAGLPVAWIPDDAEATRTAIAGALARLIAGTAEAGFDEAAFERYTARSMTRRMCAVFDHAVEARR